MTVNIEAMERSGLLCMNTGKTVDIVRNALDDTRLDNFLLVLVSKLSNALDDTRLDSCLLVLMSAVHCLLPCSLSSKCMLF